MPGPVPLLDPSREPGERRARVDAAIKRVVDSGQYILGDEVSQFEEEVASYLGSRFAIGVANGTDALTLALRSIQDPRPAMVITSAFTFFATASAAVNAGAALRLVDIDDYSLNIDPEGIRPVLEDVTAEGFRPTIVPVHLFGYACDLAEITDVTRAYDAPLVEDTAQAMGTHYSGAAVGSIGTLGCFSFFPSKNLACMGDGGLIATSDPALAERCRMLRQHGSSEKYRHEILGTNSRLDSLQAAILRVRLEFLDEDLGLRRAHAAHYRAGLDGLGGVRLPPEAEPERHSYHQFTIRVLDGARDALRKHLSARSISTAVYYPIPLHLQPALAGMDYRRGDFPVAEKAAEEVLSLPVFPQLREAERELVIESINGFFGG